MATENKPEPMTPVQLTERIDALVAEFMAGASCCETPRRTALRSVRASWSTVLSHAQHRVKQHNRAAAPAEGNA